MANPNEFISEYLKSMLLSKSRTHVSKQGESSPLRKSARTTGSKVMTILLSEEPGNKDATITEAIQPSSKGDTLKTIEYTSPDGPYNDTDEQLLSTVPGEPKKLVVDTEIKLPLKIPLMSPGSIKPVMKGFGTLQIEHQQDLPKIMINSVPLMNDMENHTNNIVITNEPMPSQLENDQVKDGLTESVQAILDWHARIFPNSKIAQQQNEKQKLAEKKSGPKSPHDRGSSYDKSKKTQPILIVDHQVESEKITEPVKSSNQYLTVPEPTATRTPLKRKKKTRLTWEMIENHQILDSERVNETPKEIVVDNLAEIEEVPEDVSPQVEATTVLEQADPQPLPKKEDFAFTKSPAKEESKHPPQATIIKEKKKFKPVLPYWLKREELEPGSPRNINRSPMMSGTDREKQQRVILPIIEENLEATPANFVKYNRARNDHIIDALLNPKHYTADKEKTLSPVNLTIETPMQANLEHHLPTPETELQSPKTPTFIGTFKY